MRSNSMKAAPATLAVVALALAASPAAALEKESIRGAALQPLRDLSVLKQKTPQILQKAAEAPYAPSGDCELMRQEIADLDKVLGQDIEAINDDGGTIVTSAVKSVIKLPFSGIIRRITGAQRRDQAYEDALVAGVARRAYLKGAMTACTIAPPLAPEETITIPLVPETDTPKIAAIPLVPETAATGAAIMPQAAPTGEAAMAVATAP